MSELRDIVERHYGRRGIGEAILSALAAAGKDLERLTPEDLAPIDEFHIRGRVATQDLAQKAGIDADKRVLDVGSGIGGPSRYLAATYGCRVTGLDLSREFCAVAAMLAEKVGLSRLVDYRQGDALAMPFDDGSFDLVWTQHAAMNISDKGGLYRETRRVLEPDGMLAIYDILAGPGGAIHFPVPWARDPSTSFLVTPEELRRNLERSGFAIGSWRDTSAEARAWFAETAGRIEREGPPPLGVHVVVGPDFPQMAQNMRRNLEEGRIVLVETVCRAV